MPFLRWRMGRNRDGEAASLLERSSTTTRPKCKVLKFICKVVVAPLRKLLRRNRKRWRTELPQLVQNRRGESSDSFNKLDQYLGTTREILNEPRKAANVDIDDIGLRNALKVFASQMEIHAVDSSSPLSGVAKELKQISDEKTKLQDHLKDVNADTNWNMKVKDIIDIAGWTIVVVSIGASIALAFLAAPPAIVAGIGVATLAFQGRTHYLDSYKGKIERLNDVQNAIDEFVESEKAIGVTAKRLDQFVTKECKEVHGLATHLIAKLDSIKQGHTAGAELLDMIRDFQGKQEQAIIKLDAIVRDAKEANEKIRRTGLDLSGQLRREVAN